MLIGCALTHRLIFLQGFRYEVDFVRGFFYHDSHAISGFRFPASYRREDCFVILKYIINSKQR